MRFLIMAMVVTTALAGCASGEHSLANYTVKPGDLSSDFELVPVDDEEYQEEFQQAGMKSNPGAGNADMIPGASSMYGSLYRHNVSGIIQSSAVRMEDADDAEMIANQFADCENQDPSFIMLRNGAVLVVLNAEDLPQEGMEEFFVAMQLIMARTGATNPCFEGAPAA